MSSKALRMARRKNAATAAQRAAEKYLTVKEANGNMVNWVDLVLSKHVSQHFDARQMVHLSFVTDVSAVQKSAERNLMRVWAPQTLTQRVVDALMLGLESYKDLTQTFPYKIREEMMQMESQRQLANDGFGGNPCTANAIAPTFLMTPPSLASSSSAVGGAGMAHSENGDQWLTKQTVMRPASNKENDPSRTPVAEVGAVQRRLAQVLVSPDKMLRLFRQHPVAEFARVVTGLYVQYERSDCPKPRVTIARIECVSMVEPEQQQHQQTTATPTTKHRTSSQSATAGQHQHPEPQQQQQMTPATVAVRDSQRVRLHIARHNGCDDDHLLLSIAQCHSPFNHLCRIPFLLYGANGAADDKARREMLNPSPNEIARKARELRMALISKV